MLLAAVWYGRKKPDFTMFIDSIRLSINELYRNGINVTLPTGLRVRIRGILLFATADLPAKADCLNFEHHNGRYGCPVC